MDRMKIRFLPGAVVALGLALLGSVACTAPEPVEPPAESALEAIELELPGRDPKLRWDSEGRLHLVYVEDGEPPRVRYARVAPGAEPLESVEPVTVSPAQLQVNAHGEVPPTLEVLPDGTLVVAYTVALPGKFQGEIRLQRSTDGGRTWSEPRLLHDDGGGNGSHSFLTSTLNDRGEVVFAWLDNRTGAQGLHTAVSGDGASVSPNRTVDAVTCQCCATELLRAGDGQIHLAYRDMSEGSVRDVFATASADHGESFRSSVLVSDDGWTLDACPHSGPRLTEDSQGRLWTVWFTGAEPGIYAAVSTDGGRTFSPRQTLAAMGGTVRHVAHPEVGRLPDGRLVATWEETRGGADGEPERGLTARFHDGAGWGEPVRWIEGEALYPRLAVEGERAVLAFTRYQGEDPRVVVRGF